MFWRRGVSLDSLEAEGLDSQSQAVIEGALELSRVPWRGTLEYVSGRVAASRICCGCDGVASVDTGELRLDCRYLPCMASTRTRSVCGKKMK